MEAPWKGEKVNPIIRGLAWFFVLCAIFASSSIGYRYYQQGTVQLISKLKSIIGVAAAPYLFLVFLKVAVSGYAPKGWIPWR